MNIWTGLLFLEGAIADASLARQLAGDGTHETTGPDTLRTDHAAARDVPTTERQFTGAGLC